MIHANFRKALYILCILFGVSSMTTIYAQTETEKEMQRIKKELEVAKFKNKENYNTEIRESKVGEDPCTLYDTPEWYTAFAPKEGRRGDAKLPIELLRLCQQQLYQKIGGAYKSVTRDYFDQMDIDAKSSAGAHIESAGEKVVEKVLNDVMEYCRKTSDPDERGNIIMYMSIRISKKEIVDKIVNELSKDKESRIRFNEEKFRESAFKAFDMEEQK